MITEELLQLNEFQEKVVDTFFECGGRGSYHQIYGRGLGLTTALMYMALNQAIFTDREVVYVTDINFKDTRRELTKVAWNFFDVKVIPTDVGIIVGHNRIRIHSAKNPDSLRGMRFNDAFVELPYHCADNYIKYDFLFTVLHANQRPSDGPGFLFTVFRPSY